MVNRSEARQAIARDMQGPNRGWNAAEVGNRILVPMRVISVMLQLNDHDRSLHIQLDLLQLGQELLQPRHAIDAFPSEVDRSQFFPVGLEGLHVRDELDERVVGHSKAALGQERRVGQFAWTCETPKRSSWDGIVVVVVVLRDDIGLLLVWRLCSEEGRDVRGGLSDLLRMAGWFRRRDLVETCTID